MNHSNGQVGTAGRFSDGPSAVVRENAVPGALNALNSSLEILQDRLNNLRDRLYPVLRDQGSTKGEKALDRAPSIVPLADTIAANDGRVRSMLGQVNEILELLEI